MDNIGKFCEVNMKRLGELLVNLIAVMLALCSLQATAAGTHLPGRDFDHSATGFPLVGGHASAACTTCHVTGEFKGTPRNCDGCHALGRQVVAIPKPTSHIVTDAPCETCHFNTYTFLGAKYNHGTAIPGQCMSCHNGRITTGRPTSHNVGLKATDSCDHCHRSYVWLPASWNHIGVVPGSCDKAGCHVAGSNQYYRSGTTHTRIGMATYKCDECHTFITWANALFNHHRPSPAGMCYGCHDGTTAVGTPAGHVNITATPDCNQCHTSTISWLGALGAKPANHIPYNAGVNCSNCHVGAPGSLVNVNTLHANSVATYTCATCHISPNPYQGNNQQTKGSHSGSSGNNCTNCHNRAGSYSSWSTN
jgi:hypothetical protein